MIKYYTPTMPDGILLIWLSSDTEQKAWDNLIKYEARGPYITEDEFIKRGYAVSELIFD